MIYVIRSAAVVDESIPSFEFILKIGYCRDDREKTRLLKFFLQYREEQSKMRKTYTTIFESI